MGHRVSLHGNPQGKTGTVSPVPRRKPLKPERFPGRFARFPALFLAGLIASAQVVGAEAPEQPPHGGEFHTFIERLNPQRTFEAGGNRVQFIPVPVFDFDPNEGPTAGVMGIFLVQRRSTNAITGIITPQYTWNEIIGHTGTLDYQGYYHRGFKLRLYGSLAERNYWEAMGTLEKDTIRGTPAFAAIEASAIRDPYPRFYGMGAGTPSSGESAFMNQEYRAMFRLGYRIAGRLSAVVEEEYIRSSIRDDVIPGVPSLLAAYPGLAGVPGSRTLFHRAAIELDTRPEGEFSRRGLFARVYGQRSDRRVMSDASWWGWGAEATALFPLGDRVYSVTRALFDHVTGSGEIPFNRLPTLGGDRALRGFGGGRFYDRGRWLFQTEIRIAVVRLDWFDVQSEMRIDPFVEVGRVFHGIDRVEFQDIEVTGGAGWRLEVRPDILVRVDLGVSRDGLVAFVKMGYPF